MTNSSTTIDCYKVVFFRVVVSCSGRLAQENSDDEMGEDTDQLIFPKLNARWQNRIGEFVVRNIIIHL